ncbi:MAG: DUF4136 domain-containing protein [Gammaproteobacteria bacterium]
MKTLVKLLGMVVVFGAPVAHAAKPQIQWNPDYDFMGARTFQWLDADEASLAQSDPFLHSRIRNAIEYQLTEKGMTEVQSNPDVYVTYHASMQSSTRLQSDSFGYGVGGYGMGGWGYYGYGGAGPVSTTTRVIEVQSGTLLIDIVDATSNELVWRGVADGINISNDPEKMQKNAVKAIEKMAKQYDKLKKKAN